MGMEMDGVVFVRLVWLGGFCADGGEEHHQGERDFLYETNSTMSWDAPPPLQ